MRTIPLLLLCAVTGCVAHEDTPPDIVARFDIEATNLDGAALPMPNDLLRDAEGRRAARSDTSGDGGADRAVRDLVADVGGWPASAPARVTFSGALDDASLDTSTVQVFAWGDTPQPVTDLRLAVDETGT